MVAGYTCGADEGAAKLLTREMMSGNRAFGEILASSSSSTGNGGSSERSHKARTAITTCPYACTPAAPKCCCNLTLIFAASSSLTYSKSRAGSEAFGSFDMIAAAGNLLTMQKTIHSMLRGTRGPRKPRGSHVYTRKLVAADDETRNTTTTNTQHALLCYNSSLFFVLNRHLIILWPRHLLGLWPVTT